MVYPIWLPEATWWLIPRRKWVISQVIQYPSYINISGNPPYYIPTDSWDDQVAKVLWMDERMGTLDGWNPVNNIK